MKTLFYLALVIAAELLLYSPQLRSQIFGADSVQIADRAHSASSQFSSKRF
jgi:hypothetical protein